MTTLNIPEAVESAKRLVGEWETQGWPDTPELGADLAEKLRQLIALASLVGRLTEAWVESANPDNHCPKGASCEYRDLLAEARAALGGK